MKTKNIVLSLLSTFAFIALVSSPVQADTCTTQYGGTTTCVPTDLTVNKQVKNPNTNVFVENLTTTDPTFTAGKEVLYKLIVKNSSGQTFDPITVRDTLPQYLTFVSGPGSYNAATRVLEFELTKMIAGETREIEVLARVLEASQLPAGKTLFCVVNTVEVSALNRVDSDSAQVCLQNGVLGVTTLPVAGVNDLLLLLPFAGVGLGGLALLKKRG